MAPGPMFPVLNTPEASDVAVWAMVSSFRQTTVVPAATVSGFVPNAEAPATAALVPIVTVVLPGFGAGAGEGDGDGAGAGDGTGVGEMGFGLLLLPHADTNSPKETRNANLNDDMKPRDRRLGAP